MLDAFIDDVEMYQTSRVILDLYEKWSPDEVLIEDRGNGTLILQALKGAGFPVVPFDASILGLILAALETETVKMAMGLQPLKDGKGKPVIDDYGRPVTELDAEGAAKISSAIARNVGTLTQIHGLFEPRALASGGMSISDDPEIRAAQRQKLLAIFDDA